MPIPLDDLAFMATVAERRAHIAAQAPCDGCGATLEDCNRYRENNTDPTAPEWFGCCARGMLMDPCHHQPDPLELDRLLREITDGAVRTVEEVDPPPLLGPERVSARWLLGQGEWWRPNRAPMIRIVDMTDTHRYHTVRMLERQATALALDEHLRMLAVLDSPHGPSGDASRDRFEREIRWLSANSTEWLHEQPLLRALRDGLPTAAKEDDARRLDLQRRARHWSTCPRNRALDAPTCDCPPPREPVVDYSGDAAGVNGL